MRWDETAPLLHCSTPHYRLVRVSPSVPFVLEFLQKIDQVPPRLKIINRNISSKKAFDIYQDRSQDPSSFLMLHLHFYCWDISSDKCIKVNPGIFTKLDSNLNYNLQPKFTLIWLPSNYPKNVMILHQLSATTQYLGCTWMLLMDWDG